jgi:hypothetical protein
MRSLLYAVFSGFLLFWLLVEQAQNPDVIEVAMPISGSFTFSGAANVLVADTSTGELTVFDQAEIDYSRFFREPLLTGNAAGLIYGRNVDLAYLDVEQSQPPSTILPYSDNAGIPTPLDLNGSGSHVLVHFSQSRVMEQLGVVDVAQGQATMLLAYTPGERLDFAPDFAFSMIRDADWNPIADEWIAVLIGGFPYVDGPPPAEQRGTVFGVLLNRGSGEKIVFNTAFSQEMFGLSWSRDGRYLVVDTDEGIDTLTFESVEEDISLRSISSVEDDAFAYVADWVGVNDLLLVYRFTSTYNEAIFSIGQIRDNELLTQEVFRIPAEPFAATVADLSIGNWVLTADEQERGELSCLFDQTVPARLEVGVRARVTFTDGTPSRLREAPGLDEAEIAQMAEGTEFSVVGGPWCADEYRWWQLELDDGMIGWSAEGDTESYFLEPVE